MRESTSEVWKITSRCKKSISKDQEAALGQLFLDGIFIEILPQGGCHQSL